MYIVSSMDYYSLDYKLTMKAIERKTGCMIYVMDIRDNNNTIIKYVSDVASYYPNELEIIEEGV